MSQVMELPIGTAAAGHREQLIDVVTSAFETDPAARWIYPDPAQYRRQFPVFAQAFGGRAFEHGTAFYSGAFFGAALWLPPGIGPDEEALMTLLEGTLRESEKQAAFAVFEQMGGYHPAEPHWYLPLIGVLPSMQGQGHGSALLQRVLRQCDKDGTPAYLESSNPRNIPLYERHGFELLGTIQVETSPPIFPMLRRPR
ncbi:MAG TPA: GNAT family N-acetyltransferase [Alphaproteobacteria bacterium]